VRQNGPDGLVALTAVARAAAHGPPPRQKLRGGLEVIKEIPKSASGKILRRLLKPQAPAAKL